MTLSTVYFPSQSDENSTEYVPGGMFSILYRPYDLVFILYAFPLASLAVTVVFDT